MPGRVANQNTAATNHALMFLLSEGREEDPYVCDCEGVHNEK